MAILRRSVQVRGKAYKKRSLAFLCIFFFFSPVELFRSLIRRLILFCAFRHYLAAALDIIWQPMPFICCRSLFPFLHKLEWNCFHVSLLILSTGPSIYVCLWKNNKNYLTKGWCLWLTIHGSSHMKLHNYFIFYIYIYFNTCYWFMLSKGRIITAHY